MARHMKEGPTWHEGDLRRNPGEDGGASLHGDNRKGPEVPAGSAPRTRRALEGFEAAPVHYDADSPAPIAGPGTSVAPSVKPRHSAPSPLQERIREELEPPTKASSKARGTAVLEGASSVGDVSPSAPDSRRRRRVPLAAKALLVLLVLIGVAGGVCWAWVSGLESSMSLDDKDRAELGEVLAAQDASSGTAPFYSLIIGSDARESLEGSRSDVIMLVRADVSTGVVTLISIPRDTMVYDDRGGVEKINAAYNYGPAATVRAVSEYAGVDIFHYVEVDFSGLEQVVDALGGVTVNIPEDIAAGNGGVEFSAGEQVLNGEEALAYARERYNVTGGDVGRAQAQRQIVEGIVRKILASSPVDMPGLISQLASCVSTDLSIADIVSYAMELRDSSDGMTLYSAAAPSYALEQDGVSYVATMYSEWEEMMRRTDAGLNPSETADPVPLEQQQDDRLGAATNAAGPRDYAQLLADGALTTWDVAE